MKVHRDTWLRIVILVTGILGEHPKLLHDLVLPVGSTVWGVHFSKFEAQIFLVETWKTGTKTLSVLKGKTTHFILQIIQHFVCYSAIGFLPLVTFILHQNPLTKSHQAPFIDASVKESWLPKQFRKCRWVTWRGVPEGVPGLGFAGWVYIWRFLRDVFVSTKNGSLKEKTTNTWSFMKFGKRDVFVVLNKHCSLQQIMKFQKGVLFKHNVHWKKLMTWGMFFPKSLRLKMSLLPM